MQDVLKEYGPALITVVAIIALIAVISFLIGHDADSIVGKAFSGLISSFFEKAQGAAGMAVQSAGDAAAAAQDAGGITP